MALTKCPECGKEVSDSAVTCPHCGYILKKKTTTVYHESRADRLIEEAADRQAKIDIGFGIASLIAGLISFMLLIDHNIRQSSSWKCILFGLGFTLFGVLVVWSGYKNLND